MRNKDLCIGRYAGWYRILKGFGMAGDVLLKTRMRKIFTSGSVKGAHSNLGDITSKKVRYELYSVGRRVLRLI